MKRNKGFGRITSVSVTRSLDRRPTTSLHPPNSNLQPSLTPLTHQHAFLFLSSRWASPWCELKWFVLLLLPIRFLFPEVYPPATALSLLQHFPPSSSQQSAANDHTSSRPGAGAAPSCPPPHRRNTAAAADIYADTPRFGHPPTPQETTTRAINRRPLLLHPRETYATYSGPTRPDTGHPAISSGKPRIAMHPRRHPQRIRRLGSSLSGHR